MNALFTAYMWFIGGFAALILLFFIGMALIFIAGQIVIGVSKLCLLLKTAYGKVVLKAG